MYVKEPLGQERNPHHFPVLRQENGFHIQYPNNYRLFVS